jgi:branched-chain amino acid aminotransferase
MTTVWWDGGLIDATDAVLPAQAHGVQYGYGLYETGRAYEGVVFRLDEHLDRLVSSAERIGLEAPSHGALRDAVHAVLAAARDRDAVVRMSVVARTLSGAPAPTPPTVPSPSSTLITAGPVPDWSAAHEAGVSVVVARQRRDLTSPLTGLKTTSNLAALLVRREALARAAGDAIILTHDGAVSECTAANVFFVRDGVLLTPSLACGCLPGVTRAVVLELAPRLGLSASDGIFTLADVQSADECFMSGSVREIVPIVRVEDVRVGHGSRGPITRDVQSAYAECVREEVSAVR